MTRIDAVCVRRSGVHGKGLFAARRIKRGERIGEYVGPIYKRASSLAKINRIKRTYVFELTNGSLLDGSPMKNTLRWANHSCAPNCRMYEEMVNGKPRLFLYALHPIEEGTEVTFDYAMDFYSKQEDLEEDRSLFTCRCGSPKCRGQC